MKKNSNSVKLLDFISAVDASYRSVGDKKRSYIRLTDANGKELCRTVYDIDAAFLYLVAYDKKVKNPTVELDDDGAVIRLEKCKSGSDELFECHHAKVRSIPDWCRIS